MHVQDECVGLAPNLEILEIAHARKKVSAIWRGDIISIGAQPDGSRVTSGGAPSGSERSD